jgi:outer membrane receptor protein involved in Fe transport
MKAIYKPGRARVTRTNELVLASLVFAASFPAFAQEKPQAATEVEEIVVTGSRIARDVKDASTPLAIIDAEELKLSGTPNLDKMLGDQPQFVQATNGGATANQVPAGSAAGAAYANLRGFGPTRSLTLVNGRRFAIFGPEQVTDLNTIPAALVKRTEVVTGGSSAVYGSDAITGVVNFIIRDDVDDIETGAQYGFDSSTNSPTFNVDLTAGTNFAGDRGNIVASLNYYKREGFTRDERGDWAKLPIGEACVTQASWSDSLIGTANGSNAANCAASGGKMGFVFAGSGDIPNGRFTLTNAQLANAGVQTALANAGLAGLGGNGFTFNDQGTGQRLVNRPADDFNLTQFNYLQVPAERYMVNAFAHFDFTEKMTGYAELHYSKNKVDQQLTQSNINATSLINVDNPYLDANMRALLVALDAAEAPNTTLPVQGSLIQTTTRNDGLAIINGGRRLVELPFRFNVDDHDVYRAAVGIRGNLGDVSDSFFRNLSYDVYYSYAKSEDTSTQDGAASRSQYAQALLRPNPTTNPVANIFGQSLSPAAVDAIAIHSENVTNAEQQVAVASLSGEAFDTWAGPVNFSFGLEWRTAEAEYLPDTYLRTGDVAGFNAGLPTSGDITAKEIFAEVRVPIVADVPAFENLSLNGAFRSSDYDLDGVGRVSTYLYGMDWRVDGTFKIRAQFQHAIRAPNIGDLFGGQQLNFPTLVDPCSNQGTNQSQAVRDVCIATGVPAGSVFTQPVQPNNTVPVISGGNPNLQEESSDTWTAGVVITPIDSLYMSIDFFDIKLDGAIAPIGGGAQNTLNLCYLTLQDPNSAFCRAVERNPDTGAITTPYALNVGQTNIGSLETAGLDFNTTYGWDAGFGMEGASRFELSTLWTWTKKFTLTPVADQPQNKNRCVGAYGSTCGEPIPEWKGITRLTWTTGPLGVSLRHRYVASVTTDRWVLPESAGANPNPAALLTYTNPHFPAYNYFDLSGTYDFGDKIEVYAGVNNITDKDPPIVAGFGGYGNTFPSTYDYAGMSFFLGVNAKF